MAAIDQLHLQSLSITGFRGIESLSIPRLGRVTLLAGKNNVGKTTVLNAVRVYAARGRYSALANLLWERDEVSLTPDDDGESMLESNWAALFHGRDISQSAYISIGPENIEKRLTIELTTLSNKQAKDQGMLPGLLEDNLIQALKVVYKGNERVLPMDIYMAEQTANLAFNRKLRARRPTSHLLDEGELPPAIECEFLGPGLLDNDDLARLWDGVALTDDEERAVGALELVFGSDVERVAVVGDDTAFRGRRGRRGRRAVVKLKNHKRPVPLRSLGDGALRLFGIALALAASRDGFLLIDEAENGIHYSVQRDYWRMVLQTAYENDVQVIATTHSKDCIDGFAMAANEFEAAEGMLVRLSRKHDDLRVVEYRERDLAIAAEQSIEVR